MSIEDIRHLQSSNGTIDLLNLRVRKVVSIDADGTLRQVAPEFVTNLRPTERSSCTNWAATATSAASTT